MSPDDYTRQGSEGFRAATALPSPAPVKPPRPGGASYPAYRTTVSATSAQINKPNVQIANVDLAATYRNGATTYDTVRSLSRVNPEMSASVATNNRVGIPEKFIAIARDPDGSFNVDATRTALQFLRQVNYMPDYINGFSQVGSLRSVSEALGKQMQQAGAMALELVLDKTRLPFAFAPVAVSQLIFFTDGKGLKPVQRVGGQDIDLDIPTFFYVALDPDLLDAYPQSPMEAAIQPVLASTQFLTDLRRICARSVYPRLDIIIDEEKLLKRIPVEVRGDTDKLIAYQNSILAEVEAVVNDLGVEEAMIHFDFFTVQYIGGQDGDVPDTFNTVQKTYNSKMATALKTAPTVLGQGDGTASGASADIQLFTMGANGMIRLKLNELYSKALTLALRLMGFDVTVEFLFDEIELRPASELMAYRQMEKEYWRGLLSDGMVTDEEVCLRLTGNLPPNGYTPRIGTYFMDSSQGAGSSLNENPTSQTSGMNNTGNNRNKPASAPKGK